MFQAFFDFLASSNPYLIYFALLVIPFIENIFPPSPSDVLIIIGGTLIAKSTISFFPALFTTTIGTQVGFMFLYYLGKQTDQKLIRAGKLKFITPESLKTAEDWFTKYGYYIILFNRFIPGIRSVISFFAGVSELPLHRTFWLSLASSIMWNIILLALGILFGENLDVIQKYMVIYANTIMAIVGVAVLFLFIRYLKKKYKK